MPTQEVLKIDSSSEYDTLLISVDKRIVTIHNMATDATHFCLTIGAADWEGVKKFVDEKLKSNN